MTKFKITATFAMSVCLFALGASSASAFFHAAKYPAKLVAHSTAPQVFKAQSNAVVECAKGQFFGTESAKEDSSQLKVTAVYAECTSKLAGGAAESATVKMNGCLYNFHQAKGAKEGTTSVECTGTSTIVIETNLGCTVKVGKSGNSFLKRIVFTNSSPNVVVEPFVEGITDEVNFICNIGGIKANKEGKYEGATLSEGFEAVSPFGKDTISVI